MMTYTGIPSSKKNLVKYLAFLSIGLSFVQNGGQFALAIPAPKDPRPHHSGMKSSRM
jgi:hypothetical protein